MPWSPLACFLLPMSLLGPVVHGLLDIRRGGWIIGYWILGFGGLVGGLTYFFPWIHLNTRSVVVFSAIPAVVHYCWVKRQSAK